MTVCFSAHLMVNLHFLITNNVSHTLALTHSLIRLFSRFDYPIRITNSFVANVFLCLCIFLFLSILEPAVFLLYVCVHCRWSYPMLFMILIGIRIAHNNTKCHILSVSFSMFNSNNTDLICTLDSCIIHTLRLPLSSSSHLHVRYSNVSHFAQMISTNVVDKMGKKSQMYRFNEFPSARSPHYSFKMKNILSFAIFFSLFYLQFNFQPVHFEFRTS